MSITKVIFDIIKNGRDYSDILIESEAPIMVKTARGWIPYTVDEYVPSWGDIADFLFEIDQGWEMAIKQGAINRPLSLSSHRLRVNAYLAFSGRKLMLSIRIVPSKPLPLNQTGLPTPVRLLLESTNGLILVSGATGSGKTTSMASMIDVINENRNSHIITIDDPIEFIFERKQAVFSQREVGVDCEGFFDGVKDALRQRPDVLGIGEIRDRDTAEQVIIAGESGHLVMGTLHAGSAVGTISKLLGYFNGQEREGKLQSIAENLVGIIHQTLIPKKDGGYALAVDFIANHKRQYSRVLGDPDKLQNMLDRNEDGVSVDLATSIKRLVQSGVVDKADAVKAVIGNFLVYDKIRNI